MSNRNSGLLLATSARPGISGTRVVNALFVVTQSWQASCGDAVRFLTWIYADSEGLRLARKHEKWQEFLALGRTYRE